MKNATDPDDEVIIAVVICGPRSDEALTMMKSAIVFRNSLKLRFIVLCDLDLRDYLRKKVANSHNFSIQLFLS